MKSKGIGNVGILQELCFQTCDRLGIHETQKKQRVSDNVPIVQHEIEKYVDQSAARYANFIPVFANGLRIRQLHPYKWIMHVVLDSTIDQLAKGLELTYIDQQVNKLHPTHGGKVQTHYLLDALKKVGQLQQELQIQPVIFSFNAQAKKLQVVDLGFLLYLTVNDRADLKRLLPDLQSNGDDVDPR